MELFNFNQETYGNEFNNHILEQWKTSVEMANAISERRTSTNNFFITLNSIIFAVISFQFSKKSICLSCMGIIICYLWTISLENYKKLNETKFKIINELEKKLPANVFDYEWELIGKGNDHKKYKKFSNLEKAIPYIFGILYIISIVYPILKEVI